MGEAHYHHHHQQQQQLLLQPHHHNPPSATAATAVPQQKQRASRVRGSAVGEIVEVEGGHIVRSTGRKDRHSKVCTAKGPRDRRVRLSAHTAIQFYDVQDRLGYDRPSKAVDWLIKNAKAAIDELGELPPWHPTATTPAAAAASSPRPIHEQEPVMADSGKKAVTMGGEPPTSSSYYGEASSFLPPSLESDAIADTINFLFPIYGKSASSSTPPIGFQNYPPDLLSRSSSQTQDLRLSLQSFGDPILFHHHNHSQPTTVIAAPHHHHHPASPTAEQVLFSSSSTPLAFDTASWYEQNSRMMVQWSSHETGASSGGAGAGGGYMFNTPVQPPQGVPYQLLGQGPFLTQRGPLQSNSPESVRLWADPSTAAASNPAAMAPFGSSIGFASGCGFSGFRIPARIQGEEEHDGMSDKPSPSASPGSRH